MSKEMKRFTIICISILALGAGIVALILFLMRDRPAETENTVANETYELNEDDRVNINMTVGSFMDSASNFGILPAEYENEESISQLVHRIMFYEPEEGYAGYLTRAESNKNALENVYSTSDLNITDEDREEWLGEAEQFDRASITLNEFNVDLTSSGGYYIIDNEEELPAIDVTVDYEQNVITSFLVSEKTEEENIFSSQMNLTKSEDTVNNSSLMTLIKSSDGTWMIYDIKESTYPELLSTYESPNTVDYRPFVENGTINEFTVSTDANVYTGGDHNGHGEEGHDH